MTLRRLSQFLAFALAALTYWVFVSRPGVVEPEFAGTIYAALFVFTLVVFGLSFLALRLATGGSATYWTLNRTDQIGPILWMIVTILAVMLAVGRILDWLDLNDIFSSTATYLLTWTLVPAAFLQFNWVVWPQRLAFPGMLKLFLVGALGLGVAGSLTYLVFNGVPVEDRIALDSRVIVRVGAVLIGATTEEILFRVLLLTALLDRLGSRFQAVFLSGIAFGLMHVPGVLAQPVAYGDWVMLQQVAYDYAPEFLMQTLVGLFLGVVWLRTGSIVLIALLHAVLNLGPTLASGL